MKSLEIKQCVLRWLSQREINLFRWAVSEKMSQETMVILHHYYDKIGLLSPMSREKTITSKRKATLNMTKQAYKPLNNG